MENGEGAFFMIFVTLVISLCLGNQANPYIRVKMVLIVIHLLVMQSLCFLNKIFKFLKSVYASKSDLKILGFLYILLVLNHDTLLSETYLCMLDFCGI